MTTIVPPQGSGPPKVETNVTVAYVCQTPGVLTCSWRAVITAVPEGQSCEPSAPVWTGAESWIESGSHLQLPSWSESLVGLARNEVACLYVHEDHSATDTLVAEQSYQIPAPVPATPTPTPSPPLGGPTATDYDCADFQYQEDAQAYLLPGDPYRLDADHDGVGCEALPHRGGWNSISAQPVPVVQPPGTSAQPGAYLSQGEAASEARRALARNYGVKWTKGVRRRLTCLIRTNDRTVGCRATWRYRHMRYRGAVVVQKWSAFYRTSTKITSRRRV
jgi:hypothetical protein